MLKMFTTQLTGLFKRIEEKAEFSFEDGARLLAQAPVGDGLIYIYGTREMKAVEFEAVDGAEPFKGVKVLTLAEVEELSDADRVLIFTRTSSDEAALEIAAILREKQVPFVSVSTVMDAAIGDLTEFADVHIDLRLTKGLLPDDFGGRFGYPSSMAALFVYYGLKFTIDEIFAEYEV
ncbi:hypothetical protein BACCIP111895_01113 [Neobacillus rhizosphaerae]|uniref:DUF2529 domain-containing protein n=1 Tax=Neobacillus rhizosphaerae TaxID=2880965 RepID=A0ABM9EMW4_9BACI|nr:DUF2529 domain-containing protein [Neobacillus rhizosphaerae]CAH2713959.1 hypothetical protein BACCIP111895_01113 [Neobacillus rhizosphaerae]